MSTARTSTSTAGTNPTRGRVLLVVAALLLQLSLGAVYAWSVFAKALQSAGPWKLSKVLATDGVAYTTFAGHRYEVGKEYTIEYEEKQSGSFIDYRIKEPK